MYTRLEDPRKQFRMLALKPSPVHDAAVKCHVHNFSRFPNPKFEALSYRWGDPDDKVPIQLFLSSYQGDVDPGDSLYSTWPVTRNLEQALRGLRLPDADRLIWIDALCIDQENSEERSQQVGIMANIYSGCIRCLLWLGPTDTRVHRAMQLIASLQGHGDSGHDRVCRREVRKADLTFSSLSDRDWNDLSSLFVDPEVWDRVWIIQELILSPCFTLICGEGELDWECIDSVLDDNREISAMFDNFNQFQFRLKETIAKASTIRMHRMPVKITGKLFSGSLLSAYFWFLDWKASDPRDKVYAILSIVRSGGTLEVSYDKTMDELSVDFAKACISEGELGLLSHTTSYCINRVSGFAGNPHDAFSEISALPRRVQWPTWIPDLSDPIIGSAKMPGLSIAGTSPYNACGSSEGMEFFQRSKCQIGPSLELMMFGIKVDTVTLVEKISDGSKGQTAKDRWAKDVYDWAPAEAREPWDLQKSYPWSVSENETFVTAYRRTLVTDRCLDKRLSTHQLKEAQWYEEIKATTKLPEELLILAGWTFGKTTAGMFCMLPPQSQAGDVLCVPFGGRVPLLLRPKITTSKQYSLIGEAYLHGAMDGAAMILGAANMHKMLQADSDHDYDHVHRKLHDGMGDQQFYPNLFTIS